MRVERPSIYSHVTDKVSCSPRIGLCADIEYLVNILLVLKDIVYPFHIIAIGLGSHGPTPCDSLLSGPYVVDQPISIFIIRVRDPV